MTKEIEQKFQAQRIAMSQALSELLIFHEWNTHLIRAAEKLCDFLPEYSYIIFPGGIAEIVNFYESRIDLLMIEHLENITKPVKIKEQIALALEVRIKRCVAKVSCKKTVNYFCQPANGLEGMQVVWRTCDLIWRYANDDSIDFNYYSKRSLLAGIYLSAIMFYLQDGSQDNNNTSNYIQALMKINTISHLKKHVNLSSIKNMAIFKTLFST